MSKIKSYTKILFSSCLLGLTITSLSIPLINAQENPPATTKTKKSTSILQALLNLLKSSENRLITRGDKVCPISPGNLGENLIYSDRPMFIWSMLEESISQSTIDLTLVGEINNYQREPELLWSKTIATNSQNITYNGEPLQSGFIYDWQFISPEKTYIFSFNVMEKTEREVIERELKAIEERLQSNNATKEEIAISKADYFANKQLWSDALQQFYTVKNPSSELKNQQQEMIAYLCQPENSNLTQTK